jgi:NAD-dependent DNA ligase
MDQHDYTSEALTFLEQEKFKAIRSGDIIRASAYKKAYEGLSSHEEPIYDMNTLINIKGIGKGILARLKRKLVGTDGKPHKVEPSNKAEYNLSEALMNIHGVGPKNAETLMKKGISSIDDLREKLGNDPKILNDVQKKGLKYYDDILQRIPREEIEVYIKLFEKTFNKVKDDSSRFITVGSYRRGAETSGDIDIFISSENKDVYKNFIDKLIKTNVIVEVLSTGPTKTLVITKLEGDSVARRVDFLYTPPSEYAFSVLYFTGSKDFNTVMRSHALKMGYTLNEHGISIKEKGKSKGDKVDQVFNDEKDIFDFFGLEYKEPNQRKNGMAVKKIKQSSEPQTLKKTIKQKKQNKSTKNKIPIVIVEPQIPSDSPSPTNDEAPTIKEDSAREPISLSPTLIKDHPDKSVWDSVPQTVTVLSRKNTSPTMVTHNVPKNTGSVQVKTPSNLFPDKSKAVTKKKRGRPKGSKNKTVKNDKMPEILEETIRETMEHTSEQPSEQKLEQPIQEFKNIIEDISQSGEPSDGEPDSERVEESFTVPIVDVKKETKKKRGRPKGPQYNRTKKLEIKPVTNISKMSDKDTIERMVFFKDKGMSYLESLSEKEINAIIILGNTQFHSFEEKGNPPTLSDNEFDIVKEYLERKHPNASALQEVGAVVEKHKADLPVNMPSMDKIKPASNAVDGWKRKYKGPYLLSCKLDGVSGLYYTLNGERKLYTRGNGTVGQDVSHLLKYINVPDVKDIIVRGEFIMTKETFENKYKKDYSNPRNLVAGIVNKKKQDLKAKDVDFVVYEMIEPVKKPTEQMALLKERMFSVVQNKTVNEINNQVLSDLLVDWRKNHTYEIDGVIVSDDEIYKRANKNPEHSFAFKMVLSDQAAESKVVDVIWSVSKNGYLKPRVRIEPVNIGGVKIEYATGFNGDFIEKNKIGVGALIQIIRSGDVIPYIKGITTPAEKPKMPDVPYTWTSTHVDIILTDKEGNVELLERTITAFFTGLEVASLSSGNVKRIIASGYDSICKILEMKEADFMKVDGFKEKMAKKIYESIQEKMKTSSLVKIMAASGKMGRGLGERKLKPIMAKYPDILKSTESAAEKKALLRQIDGVGPENAKTFVENIDTFVEFVSQCKLTYKYNSPTAETVTEAATDVTIDNTHALFGKKIVMTKVRTKEIIENLPVHGAVLENNITKSTFAVITKSKEDVSNKIIKAREMSIPIYTPEEFIEKYLK